MTGYIKLNLECVYFYLFYHKKKKKTIVENRHLKLIVWKVVSQIIKKKV